MKYLRFLLLLVPVLIASSYSYEKLDSRHERVELQSEDGLTITGDVYFTEDEDAPFIVLCHQAGYSRGEYLDIAPRLNELGFNCIAIDQRSGREVNEVVNETHVAANKLGMKTDYVDALPDIEAAYVYVKDELKAKKIILWGSSYSASLVLYMGEQLGEQVTGILAFSPGDHFAIEGKKVEYHTAGIKCPVFITSSKKEHDEWKPIYDNITSEKAYFLPKSGGFHGSKALWQDHKGHEEYWAAVEEFLAQFM